MTMLTDEERAVLEARLTEADAALHKLRMGGQVVEVRTETESVKYAAADAGRLAAYVAQLRRQLGLTARAGAISVCFR